MWETFLKICSLSIAASWLIIAVILLRLLTKRISKRITCFLWILVAIRLICPLSIESRISLIPGNEIVPYSITVMNETVTESEAYDWDFYKANTYEQPVSEDKGKGTNIYQTVIPGIWIVVMFFIGLYGLYGNWQIKKSVAASIIVKKNVLACDEVKSPFVLGIINPLIYVSSSLSEETLRHVITHEETHVRRHDHWWKPLGYVLLAVYWFNPLCWIAYILLCRDMELACDEQVISGMDKAGKASYMLALLDCNFPRKRIAACPLAFGEIDVKERVKSVINYKKPSFWIVLVMAVFCIAVAICFMTDPVSNKNNVILTSDEEEPGELGNTITDIEVSLNDSFMSDWEMVTKNAIIYRGNQITSGQSDYEAASFVPFARADLRDRDGNILIYGVSMFMRANVVEKKVNEVDSFQMPLVLHYSLVDGQYILKEYWEPAEGDNYEKSVYNMFPTEDSTTAYLLDKKNTYEELRNDCYAQIYSMAGINPF